MTTPPVLGPISFDGFEVPERITFGGRQRLVVHTMPGGGRIVDAMGPDDAPIRWSGVFSGANASSRVRVLERLRRSGTTLPLTWDSWRYSVIIQDFEAEATSTWWIPYKIELCVVAGQGTASQDWLDTAVAPALTVVALTDVALTQAIAGSSAALTGSNLASVIAAAGSLAQYVTARAYSVKSS